MLIFVFGGLHFIGSDNKTKAVKIKMTTSAFKADDLILPFAVSLLSNDLASCEERDFLTIVFANTTDNPKVFKAENLKHSKPLKL